MKTVSELSSALLEQWNSIGFIPSKPYSSYFFNVINQECISEAINTATTAQNFFRSGFLSQWQMSQHVRVTNLRWVKLRMSNIQTNLLLLDQVWMTCVVLPTHTSSWDLFERGLFTIHTPSPPILFCFLVFALRCLLYHSVVHGCLLLFVRLSFWTSVSLFSSLCLSGSGGTL